MRYAVCVAESFALGPAYIMSYLKSQGHDVRLFFDPLQFSSGDSKATWLSKLFSVEEYNIKKIEEFYPEFVLFSCTTAHYKWACRIAKKIRQKIRCKIIIGGVHATAVPYVIRDTKIFDDVISGCGIAYLGGLFNPDDILPERLDFYKEMPPKDICKPYIMTSFGCPFSCTYCLPREMKIKTPRRSVDGCIKELLWLKNNKAKEISIWDDIFTCDKKWLEEFCLRYRKEINLPFRCVSHCKFIDDKVMLLLKHAGCYMIAIGIQTGSEKLRREILNRKETNGEFLSACKTIKKHGVKLIIDHIFGIPTEDEKSFQESYDLYREADPDMVNVFQLVYFPKAAIIQHAVNNGIFPESDIPKIERGEFPQYASGQNSSFVITNPWVKKILAIPLKHDFWRFMPENLIKLALYMKLGTDFIPGIIIQNHIHYAIKRITKW